jgi:hypothetical protein
MPRPVPLRPSFFYGMKGLENPFLILRCDAYPGIDHGQNRIVTLFHRIVAFYGAIHISIIDVNQHGSTVRHGFGGIGNQVHQGFEQMALFGADKFMTYGTDDLLQRQAGVFKRNRIGIFDDFGVFINDQDACWQLIEDNV